MNRKRIEEIYYERYRLKNSLTECKANAGYAGQSTTVNVSGVFSDPYDSIPREVGLTVSRSKTKEQS